MTFSTLTTTNSITVVGFRLMEKSFKAVMAVMRRFAKSISDDQSKLKLPLVGERAKLGRPAIKGSDTPDNVTLWH